jgi:MarR family transcriptional regulator, lower aerobic nicotinate degradation pathway regulator
MAKAQKNGISQEYTTDAEIRGMFTHPGFLIRRAQQIAVSSFYEHYGAHGVTPTQSVILKLVRSSPGLDQVGVGRVLGLDRTTATQSVTTLANAGLIERRNDPRDGRRKTLYITPKGKKLMDALGNTDASARSMLAVFSKDDAATFMRLLEHFVTSSNESIRIPMETPKPPKPRHR